MMVNQYFKKALKLTFQSWQTYVHKICYFFCKNIFKCWILVPTSWAGQVPWLFCSYSRQFKCVLSNKFEYNVWIPFIVLKNDAVNNSYNFARSAPKNAIKRYKLNSMKEDESAKEQVFQLLAPKSRTKWMMMCLSSFKLWMLPKKLWN